MVIFFRPVMAAVFLTGAGMAQAQNEICE